MAILEFAVNIPQTVALAFSDGKEFPSQFPGSACRMMFTLASGDRMFVSPVVADKIKQLGISPHRPFEICKRQVGKSIQWQVTTPNATEGKSLATIPAAAPGQSVNRTAAPRYTPATEAPDEPSDYDLCDTAHRDTGLTAALDATYAALDQPRVAAPAQPRSTTISMEAAACLAASIDAWSEAQTYAGHRGLRIQATSEDIRAFAISIFIERSKRGGA